MRTPASCEPLRRGAKPQVGGVQRRIPGRIPEHPPSPVPLRHRGLHAGGGGIAHLPALRDGFGHEHFGGGDIGPGFPVRALSELAHRSSAEYWGAEPALKSARYYRTRLSEDMAPVLASRCGGNPFYITAVVRRSVEKDSPVGSEERINEILAVDLSSGFIWGSCREHHGQGVSWSGKIPSRVGRSATS